MLRVAKLALGNLAVLALLVLGCEWLARVVRPGFISCCYTRTYPGQYQNAGADKLNWPREDPDLGWVYDHRRSEVTMHSSNPDVDRHMDYRCNAQGFRDARDFDRIDRDSGRTRVMMLGDSFLFGPFLEEREIVSAHLERRLGQRFEVYNLGIPGWGLDQMLLAYERYADRIRPQVVILFFIDDDIKRVYEAYREVEGLNKPSFRLDRGRLALRTEGPGLVERLWSGSFLFNELYYKYALYDSRKISEAIFARMARATERRGEQFIVARCPYYYGQQWDQQAWKAAGFDDFFAPLGVRYVDLIDEMGALPSPEMQSLFIPGDGHLSAKGAGFAADVLWARGLGGG